MAASWKRNNHGQVDSAHSRSSVGDSTPATGRNVAARRREAAAVVGRGIVNSMCEEALQPEGFGVVSESNRQSPGCSPSRIACRKDRVVIAGRLKAVSKNWPWVPVEMWSVVGMRKSRKTRIGVAGLA